jgi:hypothetical protein
VIQHGRDLLRRNGLAPVRELHDRPDPDAFARHSPYAEVFAEPGRLSGDPGGVLGVAEARVIGHRAEHVDEPALRAQVDGELLAQRTLALVVRPRAVERAEQRLRSRLVDDAAELAHPVREDAAPPRGPGVALLAEQILCDEAGVLLEPRPATRTKARVRQHGLRAFPAGVRVVVVEPHAVDLVLFQQAAKRLHAKAPVGHVRRADALPAVGRRRALSVRSHRRGVGVLLQVVRAVQRVELGEDLRALRLEPRDPLLRDAPFADPDRVDPRVPKRLALLHEHHGHAAVDAPDRDVRAALRRLAGPHEARQQQGRPSTRPHAPVIATAEPACKAVHQRAG